MSSPTRVLDINADMGEGYGRWPLGDDAAVLPHVTSANIACGFHAGDAGTMRRTVCLAQEHGVAVGAHIGLPDLLGFGRRAIAASTEEVRDYATYQIGALAAIAAAEGATLTHVKPHGALYAMCSRNLDYAGAVASAVADIDRTLVLLLLSADVAPAVDEHGVTLVREAFVDLDYHRDGSLIIEATKRAWDPERVAERALRLAETGTIITADGAELAVDAQSICVHGDAPNAADVARAVRQALDGAGVIVRAPWAVASA
jgi:5-oxoprolinase (ATP-hydrolysing) subunit A